MHAQIPDRRRAGRLQCQVPVLLHSAGRSLRATVVDLSRVGALLRLPCAEIGLDRDIPLAQLGRAATFLLGDIVRVDLHYEVLGTLIQRSARPVRLGRPHPLEDAVEIGLDLLEPITDNEVEFLGLALPMVRDDEPATWVPEPSLSRSTNGSPAVTVLLCNDVDDRTPPLRVTPAYVDRHGVQLDLGTNQQLPILPEQPGAAGVLTMLAETYGGSPRTVMMVGGEPVWAGPSHISAVEVCPYDQSVRVQIGFANELPDRASVKLGVA